jgi:tripartite-type tricarboxylate transporter receptor subunit TctC
MNLINPTCLRRRFLGAVAVATLCLGVAPGAHAQNFPTKTIRMVIPYTAGSVVDVSARTLAEAMSAQLGSPVVVDNKPGASGKIAADIVARAEPDGHTLLFAGTPQLVVLPILDKKINYNALNDFRMVAIATEYDLLLMTSPSSGINSVKDLLQKMQAPDAKVDYGTVGVGPVTPVGLAAAMFARMGKGKVQEVSYQGGGPMMIDLMAGRLAYAFNTIAGNEGNIKEGRIKVLAVATPKRLKQLPDVPTFAEAGMPEFLTINWSSWNALVAPAKTPDAVVNRLNAAVAKGFATPEINAKLEGMGLHNKAGASAVEQGRTWREEHARLGKLLQEHKIEIPE